MATEVHRLVLSLRLCSVLIFLTLLQQYKEALRASQAVTMDLD